MAIFISEAELIVQGIMRNICTKLHSIGASGFQEDTYNFKGFFLILALVVIFSKVNR